MLEQAVPAGTRDGGRVELTVQQGRSQLLAELAGQAGIKPALLPRITGPYTITVTAEHASMRPFVTLSRRSVHQGRIGRLPRRRRRRRSDVAPLRANQYDCSRSWTYGPVLH